MRYDFIRLELLANQLSEELNTTITLDEMLRVCEEQGVATTPIDLGGGAALLIETAYEQLVRDCVAQRVVPLVEDEREEEEGVPLADKLEAMELQLGELMAAQKRIGIVLNTIEGRLAKVATPGMPAAIDDLKKRVAKLEENSVE